MNLKKSSALIPSLQSQMQWFSGQPQISGADLSRVLYDFNNPENILERKTDIFTELVEVDTNLQESSICDPETGMLSVYYNGESVFDGFHNKLNSDPIEAMTQSFFTSVIAPNVSRNRLSYNVFYVDNLSKHIDYAIIDFPDGFQSPGTYIGKKTLESTAMPSPLGLACVNEAEYWVLALNNTHTLIAYRFDNTGAVYPAIHVSLEPLLNLSDDNVDCMNSSIVCFGEKIAITVNGVMMAGEMLFSGTAGFSIFKQVLVDEDVSSLAPAFNKDKSKLYYLKEAVSGFDHVYVYEIDPGASYSANSSYNFTSAYLTLKLAPNGKIYGTDLFSTTTGHVDPLLVIEEISTTDSVTISEIVTDTMYSSKTFGNIQYQINSLDKKKGRYS